MKDKQTDKPIRTASRAGRPTIAYLTPYIEANRTQWTGIVDEARKRDVNLICFEGGYLTDPEGFQAQANVLYDLVHAESVDGVISWTTLISNYVTADEIRTFHKRYHSLPLVTIGGPFDGIPCVLFDSYKGMHAAIVHLIEVHGCRRLAFISGPEGNVFAQERYQAYTDALEAHDIPLDPNLITPPAAWAILMGKRAMRLLLDERRLRPHIDFDAVVAASDHLLLGVLEILHERGIHVPRDVAVVGFDDIEQARVSVPPFTTGVRPSYEMGCQLVETLLALIEGTPVPAKTIVPSGLVIRQSCGCVGLAVKQARVGPVEASSETLDAVLASRRADILAAMAQAVGESEKDVGDGVERLLDGFIGELKGEASGLLMRELDGALHQMTAAGGDVTAWQGAISALRQHLLPHLRGQTLALAEDLWQQVRVAVAEMALLTMEQKRAQAIKRAQVFREIGAALITTFDIGGLMAILTQCLPRLSIPSCYLSLYEEPNKPTEWSRLILAYNEHERIEIAPEGWRFPSRRLIPEEMMPLERRYSFVVKELYFQEHQIGFVLFGAGPLDGTIYETLHEQISSALQGALLIQEREHAKAALETAYAEVEKQVEERTAELRIANQEMEALFERLLRQEKLATIGQITGSIAHELRNPLGAVKQSAFFLNRLYQRQQLHASNPKVKEHLALIKAELDIAERVISDLLQMTRMKQPQCEYTNLRPIILDAISRCPLPEQIHFTLNVSPEPFLVLADPSQLRQVLINLFTNAVQAIEQDGSIMINAKQLPEDGSCVIEIEDTGLGIAPEVLKNIFEPLYTTKATGTGLGLSICKQIIEKHQGQISVKSQVGQGTTVTIVLPNQE